MEGLFHSVDDYPDVVSAGAVMARLLDGLGFRFRWATDGFRRVSPEQWAMACEPATHRSGSRLSASKPFLTEAYSALFGRQ